MSAKATSSKEGGTAGRSSPETGLTVAPAVTPPTRVDPKLGAGARLASPGDGCAARPAWAAATVGSGR